MILRTSVPFKYIFLWCLITACGVVTAYLCFVSLVSIWIGIAHSHLSGWWAPVLTGTAFLIVVLLAFLRTSKNISAHLKQKDALLP